MEIRKRLSYQFIAIFALILFISSLTIYLSFSSTRKTDFYDRLGSKAKMVAQMLIEFDEIDAELLKRIELNNPLSLPNEIIIIYDNQDQLLYSTDYNQQLKISSELANSVRINKEIHLKQDPFEILGQFYTANNARFVVFAAATDIFGFRKIKRLQLILLIVFFLSLVIAFIASRIFATRALHPISNIMAQAEAIGISNLDARIDEGSGNDEITQLSRTFNQMLERLEIAFLTQKNFIANASHELRTPLTVITGQLEVNLLKERSNEEYRLTILSLLDDIKNLNQISNRLLLLAQTSSEFPETGFEPVRIDDTIWLARNEILKRQDHYRVDVHFSQDIDNEDILTVRGNELLLKTAILNLIDNACKYSDNHAVDVQLESNDKEIFIRFSDHGIGIPEEEIALIFQPFYRAGNAKRVRGHGIGLSLVERIIKLHGGGIDVKSSIGQGTEFTIHLRSIKHPLTSDG